MFVYLLSLTAALSFLFTLYNRKKIVRSYHALQNLAEFVGKNRNSIAQVMKLGLTTMWKFYWIKLYQRMNKSVELHSGKKTFIVS